MTIDQTAANVPALLMIDAGDVAPTAADGITRLAEIWLAQLDVAPSTRATYRRNVRVYAAWLAENGIAGYPTRSDVLAFKAAMTARYAANTVKSRMSTVKGLHGYATAEHGAPDPTRGVKASVGRADDGFRRDYLTAAQVGRMLNGVDRSGLAGKRDYAMLALMATAGLRTIEVARADIGDLRTVGDSRVLYVQGKGRASKDAIVKIAPEVDEALAVYLQARRAAGEHVDEATPLFAPAGNRRSEGGRLTTRSVSRLAKTAMQAAGMDDPRLTAHSLRHTTATLALLDGAPLEEVQAALRHRSITTTMVYAHHINAAANTTAARVASRIFAAA